MGATVSSLVKPGRTSLPFTEMAVLGASAVPSRKVREPSCVIFKALRTSRTDMFAEREQSQVSVPVVDVSGS